MITAENVREVRFTKAMGGYKTAEVDSFLDKCADTIEALTKNIDENTRKMQVLAETIVDYRNQEDSIRTALLSAQRMSETVIAEANEKAEAIISDANAKAETIKEDSKKQIQAELDELTRIQKEVSAFRSRLLATYREHLTLIGVLAEEEKKEEPVEESSAVIEEAAIDDNAANADEEQSFEETPFSSDDEVKIDISAFELNEDEG